MQDEATQYSGVEEFVNYFVGMCRSENNNAQIKAQLRIAGLRGLRAYTVILDYADELDSFVSKQSQARIIPTILDNMQYEATEYTSFFSFPLLLSSALSSYLISVLFLLTLILGGNGNQKT